MNNRRKLLVALGAAAFSPRMAVAQSKQPVLIGWLEQDSRKQGARFLAAFRDGMAALGWKEGSQFVIEERWADTRVEQLQPLAEELAARKPAVIVVAPLRTAPIATKAAPQTPIVVVAGGDPAVTGVVASLARPGGMVTGVTALSSNMTEKFLELLLAAAPGVRRVGFLTDPRNSNHARIMEGARRSAAQYSVEARFAEAASASEIESAVSRLTKEGAQALIVTAAQLFITERARITKLALAQRWPIVSSTMEFAEEGALLAYGADRSTLYRRAAYYVDRILKGAKPGDLPFEQPTKFELIVNMKTAKALGLTIPQSFLMRADRVIE